MCLRKPVHDLAPRLQQPYEVLTPVEASSEDGAREIVQGRGVDQLDGCRNDHDVTTVTHGRQLLGSPVGLRNEEGRSLQQASAYLLIQPVRPRRPFPTRDQVLLKEIGRFATMATGRCHRHEGPACDPCGASSCYRRSDQLDRQKGIRSETPGCPNRYRTGQEQRSIQSGRTEAGHLQDGEIGCASDAKRSKIASASYDPDLPTSLCKTGDEQARTLWSAPDLVVAWAEHDDSPRFPRGAFRAD